LSLFEPPRACLTLLGDFPAKIASILSKPSAQGQHREQISLNGINSRATGQQLQRVWLDRR
jgi:hypothetical protein